MILSLKTCLWGMIRQLPNFAQVIRPRDIVWTHF